MTDLLHARRVSGPCLYCKAARPLVDVRIVHKGRQRRAVLACAVCLSKTIDEALGWQISNQVLQATVAREAAAEARAAYNRRGSAVRLDRS